MQYFYATGILRSYFPVKQHNNFETKLFDGSFAGLTPFVLTADPFVLVADPFNLAAGILLVSVCQTGVADTNRPR